MATTLELHLPHVVVGSRHLTYYIVAGFVVLVVWLQKRKKTILADVPFYKAGKTKWMFDAENLIIDSYGLHRDRAYSIKATEGPQVLIPANLIGELKGLPEDVLSATEAVSEALMSKYTKFCPGHNGEMLATVVRTKLSQNLTRLVPQLKAELEYITATEFPECNDWTPVKFQPFALRTVARLSGYAFVGSQINRLEQWMDTSINFAIHVFIAVVKLQLFPEWLRPVGQFLVSELGQIQRDMQIASQLLKPVIEERLRDLDTPSYEKPPDDLIQWLIEALPPEQRTDFEAQAHLQLILAAASIHTTNNLLTECMYDLAAYPDVQRMLREEAYQVLEVEGGWARKESMAKLKKMDSFMREVQRLSGNITAFIRKVVKPIDLSDGTHLPEGTKILLPQAGISHDTRYYSSPEAFDALRFYNLRQRSEEDSNKWQFTTIGDTYANFGLGKHACPGRFFAGNEIKMALSYFLLNYDIKLKDGESRPKSMVMVMTKTPNPKAEILFKRRTVDS